MNPQTVRKLAYSFSRFSSHVFVADSHIKNERKLENSTSEKPKYSIRNRGSCSSSSDSTAGNNYEEDVNSLRQRERPLAKYARTFSLQDERMPLSTPREDLDVSGDEKVTQFVYQSMTGFFLIIQFFDFIGSVFRHTKRIQRFDERNSRKMRFVGGFIRVRRARQKNDHTCFTSERRAFDRSWATVLHSGKAFYA